VHLSGSGGSHTLSVAHKAISVAPGEYQVTADFDREGAALGMSVGTLTVGDDPVTITCRSKMSLCMGTNLRR
jgi:hypothetical protein